MMLVRIGVALALGVHPGLGGDLSAPKYPEYGPMYDLRVPFECTVYPYPPCLPDLNRWKEREDEDELNDLMRRLEQNNRLRKDQIDDDYQ